MKTKATVWHELDSEAQKVAYLLYLFLQNPNSIYILSTRNLDLSNIVRLSISRSPTPSLEALSSGIATSDIFYSSTGTDIQIGLPSKETEGAQKIANILPASSEPS